MLRGVLCPRRRDGAGADADDGIWKVKRQLRSFRRLRERAPLSSAGSARLETQPRLSPTLPLWPASRRVEENSKAKGK